MYILIDSKMPEEAKRTLASYGELIEFATQGITYDAISGHPDIFFCPTPKGLIVAPNLPEKYFEILNTKGITYTTGQQPVGNQYPFTAVYNSLVTSKYVIQNTEISDSGITALNPSLEVIHINQGYARCSLLALPNDSFITSDQGIAKVLINKGKNVLFVDPSSIKLEGFTHGFFGGVCGLNQDKLFICGGLSYFQEKTYIEKYTAMAGVHLIELYQSNPVDVGTILCIGE